LGYVWLFFCLEEIMIKPALSLGVKLNRAAASLDAELERAENADNVITLFQRMTDRCRRVPQVTFELSRSAVPSRIDPPLPAKKLGIIALSTLLGDEAPRLESLQASNCVFDRVSIDYNRETRDLEICLDSPDAVAPLALGGDARDTLL